VQSSSSDDITIHIYEEGRHEMLNEINRDDVLDDMWEWMEPRVSAMKKGERDS
jgi:alpha-beta hydrolase superfamily lysophospholipase